MSSCPSLYISVVVARCRRDRCHQLLSHHPEASINITIVTSCEIAQYFENETTIARRKNVVNRSSASTVLLLFLVVIDLVVNLLFEEQYQQQETEEASNKLFILIYRLGRRRTSLLDAWLASTAESSGYAVLLRESVGERGR